MKGSMDTHMGSILVDSTVVANYAGSVAVECVGVVGMASVNVRDGFVGLLKKESMSKGITVSMDNNKMTLNLHIIVAYGCGIMAVANNVMSEVKYKVEQFTGLDVDRVNVFVEGVKVVE